LVSVRGNREAGVARATPASVRVSPSTASAARGRSWPIGR
jgi:hypothetical protein